MNGHCGMEHSEFMDSLRGLTMGHSDFMDDLHGLSMGHSEFMDSLHGVGHSEFMDSSLAVTAASIGAVAVSATLGEVCAAQTHRMEVAITGSAVDKGIISRKIQLGLGTTELGHGTTGLANTGLGLGSTEIDLLTAFTDPSCGSITTAVFRSSD